MGPKPVSKPPFTHFLCLPLITPSSLPQLRSSLSRFKSIASNPQPLTKSVELQCGTSTSPPRDPSPPGPMTTIPDRAFRPLGTLHLTLGVMSLQSQTRLESVLRFLGDLDLEGMLQEAGRQVAESEDEAEAPQSSQSIDPAPGLAEVETLPSAVEPRTPMPSPPAITISLQSLVTRPNEPASNCSVLYAKPIDGSGRLLPFCQSLLNSFVSAGFIEAEKRPLLLHATVVNTVYCGSHGHGARGRGGAGSKNYGRDRGTGRLKLDVRGLVEDMERDGKEWIWAQDFRVERVAVCEMGAKKVESEGGEEIELGEEYNIVTWRDLR